jgi:hypothetical protein
MFLDVMAVLVDNQFIAPSFYILIHRLFSVEIKHVKQ